VSVPKTGRSSSGSSSVFMLTIILPLLTLLMFFGVELLGYAQQLERLQNVTDEAARTALRYGSHERSAAQRIISNMLNLHFGPSPDRVVMVSGSATELSVEVNARYEPKLLFPFLAEEEKTGIALSLSAVLSVRVQRPPSTVFIETVGSQATICNPSRPPTVLEVATDFTNQVSSDPRDNSSIWFLRGGAFGDFRKIECGITGCDFAVDQDDCVAVGGANPQTSMQRLLEFLISREQQRTLDVPQEIRDQIGMEQIFYFSLSLGSEVGGAYEEAVLLREELNRYLNSRNGSVNLIALTSAKPGDTARSTTDGRVAFSPVALADNESPPTLAARLISLHAVELVSR
jgi:Flp pilus assembly protein TadG